VIAVVAGVYALVVVERAVDVGGEVVAVAGNRVKLLPTSG